MNGFDAPSVLHDLERADTWVDITDAVRLVETAGFVLADEEGEHRIYRHADTGEILFLNMRGPVAPQVGPVIADKIKNYWP